MSTPYIEPQPSPAHQCIDAACGCDDLVSAGPCAQTFAENAVEVPITRDEFQTWTKHILNRIELPIRRVLGDAKLKREAVHEVILVGGATRMPMVVDRVIDLMGKSPQRRLNPDEVVALGAAVQAFRMLGVEPPALIREVRQ